MPDPPGILFSMLDDRKHSLFCLVKTLPQLIDQVRQMDGEESARNVLPGGEEHPEVPEHDFWLGVIAESIRPQDSLNLAVIRSSGLLLLSDVRLQQLNDRLVDVLRHVRRLRVRERLLKRRERVANQPVLSLQLLHALHGFLLVRLHGKRDGMGSRRISIDLATPRSCSSRTCCPNFRCAILPTPSR